MFTRKLMPAVLAAAAGLIGLGAVLADAGPPPAPPVAAPPEPLPQPPAGAVQPQPPAGKKESEFTWQNHEAQVRDLLSAARQEEKTAGGANGNKPLVLIDAMCVRVPAGFCDRCGLTPEEGGADRWFLSPRERRMLSALIAAEPTKGVLGRPQLQIRDGQTGYLQCGQSVAVVTAETKDGKTVDTSRVAVVDIGIKLQVVPTVGADGRIRLGIETETSEQAAGPAVPRVAPPVTPAGGKAADATPEAGQAGPVVFNKQSVLTTVVLPDAGTVVLRSAANGTKPAVEQLWVLSAYHVRNDKKDAAPVPVPTPPKPAPVAPAIRP
jgi:hypothetical protein